MIIIALRNFIYGRFRMNMVAHIWHTITNSSGPLRHNARSMLDIPCDQFEKLLSLALDSFITSTQYIEDHCLYRARIEDSTDPHTHQQHLWYPPQPDKIRMGRFNKAGEAILYTSNDRITAMIELWHSLGEEEKKQSVISINLCSIVPKLESCTRLDLAHLGLIDNNFSPNPAEQILGNPHMNPTFLSQIASPDDPEYINRLNLHEAVDKFLSMICTHNSEGAYQFSNEIWQKLKKIPTIGGLIYPSVANDLSTKNFAILPSSADGVFRIDSVYKYQIPRSALPADLPCFKELMDKYHVNTGEVDQKSGEIKWRRR